MFRFTKKIEYSLLAVKHMSMKEPGALSSAKEIAETYDIPLELLSKILQGLARKGIIKSVQGSGGGYHLADGAISIYDIIEAVEGPFSVVGCHAPHREEGRCKQFDSCTVRGTMSRVSHEITDLLKGIQITDMARKV